MSVPQRNVEQIRHRLVERRAHLSTRRRRVEQDLARQHDPLVQDSDDRAIQLENDGVLEAIGEAALQEIAAIDAALARLELGRYGVCNVCEEAIEPARLQAVPHAIACARCLSH